jgi:predicted alpha/beta hydrolase family esterase
MSDAPIVSEKSTTGRSLFLRWQRFQLGLGATVAPAFAERHAARLFATPRRLPQPQAEHDLLARARPFRVGGLAAWRWGGGPPVLLVHGWEGRGAQLGSLVAPLVSRGLSVVTFDAPAHGASPGTRATLSDFADAITRVGDRIGAPAGIVAHSFGALATLLAVKRGLSTKAITLVGPPSPRERLAWFQEAFAIPDEVMAGMRRIVERRVGASFDDVEGARLAEGLSIPGLLLHDRRDKEASWEITAAIARAWPAATLDLTEGLGHRRILQDPAVVRRVTDFVARRALSSAAVHELRSITPLRAVPERKAS